MLRDIQDRADVAELVTTFYRSAFQDDLIGPIFTDVAHLDLDRHLPIMCDFWETVLFRAGVYHRNAFGVHVDLDAKVRLTGDHFDRWLELWTANVDAQFSGEKAELAKTQASRVAASIHRRLQNRSGGAPSTVRQGDRPSLTLANDPESTSEPEGASL